MIWCVQGHKLERIVGEAHQRGGKDVSFIPHGPTCALKIEPA